MPTVAETFANLVGVRRRQQADAREAADRDRWEARQRVLLEVWESFIRVMPPATDTDTEPTVIEITATPPWNDDREQRREYLAIVIDGYSIAVPIVPTTAGEEAGSAALIRACSTCGGQVYIDVRSPGTLQAWLEASDVTGHRRDVGCGEPF